MKAKKEEERKRKEFIAYQNRPGLALTHIKPDGSITKERLKSQVFQQHHRPPTMSLEEFADIEVKDAMERQARQKKSENDPNRPGVKMKQLVEMGKEDDEELCDKATVRDRQWDNWKDMNPKGYGVTKKI